MTDATLESRPRPRVAAAAVTFVLVVISIAAPALARHAAVSLIGLAALGCGVVELGHTVHAHSGRAGASPFVGGMLSVLTGLALLCAPTFAGTALTLLLAASYTFDGIVIVRQALRQRAAGTLVVGTARGIVNVVVGLLIGLQWPLSGAWALGLFIGVRIMAAAFSMLRRPVATAAAPRAVDAALPHIAALRRDVEADEEGRAAANTTWRLAIVATLFAIHVGRMEADWTAVGLLSPAIATLGDCFLALLLAFALIVPARLVWRKLTMPFERRAGEHLAARENTGGQARLGDLLIRRWLIARLRFSVQIERVRGSIVRAAGRGLQTGLPLTAILVATVPIWGFSWVFNTENWATGFWNSWVEGRTDSWRVAMVRAAREDAAYRGAPQDAFLVVEPPGVAGAADFSFIVIGDTGEGDASQHVLRDRYLSLGRRPDVAFLVISSDVIYPAGAMKDYEPNFYLPFKGFEKPIYAIPGNHDWYDALEGFVASFYEAPAAGSAMRARVREDRGLTMTTERRIDDLIAEAARLRESYGVRTGLQRAPYFEIHADRFSLIMVDTGILKRIDADQMAWLRAALGRAGDRFTMVILGHPLYAGHRYQGEGVEEFAEIHRLLREREVPIVMAGDTHDFEYYVERYETAGGAKEMHHFVNGGGGAYLSIGTALERLEHPVVPDCAFYPAPAPVIAKLDRETPLWKRPLWFWVKRFGAWPLSAETLGAAFDFNAAPFFQSFMEVRVEGSTNTVRLLLHGASGQLRWRDLWVFGAVVPAGAGPDDFVEFAFSLSRSRAAGATGR